MRAPFSGSRVPDRDDTHHRTTQLFVTIAAVGSRTVTCQTANAKRPACGRCRRGELVGPLSGGASATQPVRSPPDPASMCHSKRPTYSALVDSFLSAMDASNAAGPEPTRCQKSIGRGVRCIEDIRIRLWFVRALNAKVASPMIRPLSAGLSGHRQLLGREYS